MRTDQVTGRVFDQGLEEVTLVNAHPADFGPGLPPVINSFLRQRLGRL